MGSNHEEIAVNNGVAAIPVFEKWPRQCTSVFKRAMKPHLLRSVASAVKQKYWLKWHISKLLKYLENIHTLSHGRRADNAVCMACA